MKVRKTNYTDGVQYHFDNRSVTTWKDKEGLIGVEFRIIDKDPSPRANTIQLKGKLCITAMKISPEAASTLLLALSELMSVKIKK